MKNNMSWKSEQERLYSRELLDKACQEFLNRKNKFLSERMDRKERLRLFAESTQTKVAEDFGIHRSTFSKYYNEVFKYEKGT